MVREVEGITLVASQFTKENLGNTQQQAQLVKTIAAI